MSINWSKGFKSGVVLTLFLTSVWIPFTGIEVGGQILTPEMRRNAESNIMLGLRKLAPKNDRFFTDRFASLPKYEDEDALVSIQMGPDLQKKISSEYRDLNDEYERKRRYSLLAPEEERAHFEKMSGYSHYIFRYFVNSQVQSVLKTAEKRSPEARAILQVKKSVEKITRGSMNFDVSETVKVNTKTNIPEKKGSLSVTSPYMNALLAVDFGSEITFDLHESAERLDPNRITDRYRVSLYRDIPVVDLSSSLSYGTDSKVFIASIGKNITKNLRWEVSATRDSRSTPLFKEQESVKLLYGVRF